ncbi:CYTH domain-containing protein [Aeromonas sp. 43P]|uniref:CYTH domain-containing protein n=1 Tax=Aeromonas sp. 43P TaxID=3115854 RepID=UPI002E7B1E3A|nr:CYTH domain-containing protein [Aeromonas sp. 43P]MEE1955806.1 CYTH domain-containing protein [Aeromonas sp. 43P]
MRRDGDQFIQTLKTRGQSVAGLSERTEWDWYLPKAKLDTKKLSDECWPASLAELDKKTLAPLFTTDFVRQRAEVAWGRGKAKVASASVSRGSTAGRRCASSITVASTWPSCWTCAASTSTPTSAPC